MSDRHPSPPAPDPFKVVMLVFPGMTQLDLTGPWEVLMRVRGVSIELAWKTLEPVASAALTPPPLRLLPTIRFADVGRADLLCVPGGPGHIDLLNDLETLQFIARVAADARYVTSVCTGSLILGAAGLLRGYRATTHWASLHCLAAFGAIPEEARVVIDRNRITGGGVTSGLDFGLHVIRELWGERAAQLAQLTLEYDPQPPTSAGSPRTAPPALVEDVRRLLQPLRERQALAVQAAVARLRGSTPPG